MQILKRPYPILEMLKKLIPLTSTKKAKKPRKKRKKSKKQIIKSLDELKPIFIAMIGAAAYRFLTRKKDVKIFSITLCQINQILDSLNSQNNSFTVYVINPVIIKKIRAKLFFEYHEFLNIFDRSKVNKLLSHRLYDHKIKLKKER
jgi:hypothetical protein